MYRGGPSFWRGEKPILKNWETVAPYKTFGFVRFFKLLQMVNLNHFGLKIWIIFGSFGGKLGLGTGSSWSAPKMQSDLDGKANVHMLTKTVQPVEQLEVSARWCYKEIL